MSRPRRSAQDEDVLDTWFSSALVAVFDDGLAGRDGRNWRRYYPTTSTLITGFDIIFFWGRADDDDGHCIFMDEVPFPRCLYPRPCS